MKIKATSFIGNITKNEKTGRISLHEIIDNISVYMTPTKLTNTFLYLDFSDIEKEEKVEIEIIDELKNIVFHKELLIEEGFNIKKIINIKEFPIKSIGILSLVIKKQENILMENSILKVDFMKKRELDSDQIKEILDADNLIKRVNIELPMGKEKVYKYQILLDKSLSVDDGYEKFPKNYLLKIDDNEYNLEGYYNHATQLFGKKLPSKDEIRMQKEAIEAKKTMNIIIED